jgi:hypothetical protein
MTAPPSTVPDSIVDAISKVCAGDGVFTLRGPGTRRADRRVISLRQIDIYEAAMIRTLISLDPDDKRWLDQKSAEENVTMTELVRRAVRRYREECEAGAPPLDRLLEETSGLWKQGDGLEYQRRLREEWEEER